MKSKYIIFLIMTVFIFASCGAALYSYKTTPLKTQFETTDMYFAFYRVNYNDKNNNYISQREVNDPGVTSDADFMFEVGIMPPDSLVDLMNKIIFDTLIVLIPERDTVYKPRLYQDTVQYYYMGSYKNKTRRIKYGPFKIEGSLPKKATIKLFYSMQPDEAINISPRNPIIVEAELDKKTVLEDFLDGR